MLFEGLARLSQEGKTEFALAEELEISPDGLQYEFRLKKSLWSDGTPVTAHDFERSWKSILDPQFPTSQAYHLFVLKNGKRAKEGEVSLEDVGVRAIGPYQLVVTLEAPTPYFTQLLSLPCFFPTPPPSSKSGVSNGPYQLEESVPLDHLTFSKNPFYQEKEKLCFEKIVFLIAPPETALQLFAQKKLDWVGSPFSFLPTDALAFFREQKVLEREPFCATAFLRINTGKKELSSPRLRRVLSRAIDREAIASQVLQGGQQPAYRLVPSSMGLRSSFPPEEALQEERVEQVAICYPNSERNQAVAQALQEQWKKGLGIEVALQPEEAKTFFHKIAQGDYEVALGSWMADFYDPINFLEVFESKNNGTNNTGWENPEFQALLKASSLCREEMMRKTILSQAETLLLEEAPIIPLYHYVLNYMKGDGLENITPSPLGYFPIPKERKAL